MHCPKFEKLTHGIAFVVACLVVCESGARADDGLIPESEKEYRVRVIDEMTGGPAAGVRILAREERRNWHCYSWENESCGNCSSFEDESSQVVVSDELGLGKVTFSLEWCRLINDDPARWLKQQHLSWLDPVVIEAEEGESWILSRIEPGPSPQVHTVFVISETWFRDQFAPVLHAHPRELQEGLADIEDVFDRHGTLTAYRVTGQTLFGPARTPPAHVWGGHQWDSFGRGTIEAWWTFDIDNDQRYRGAEIGDRPIYSHVFPHEDGVVIQYWLWWNCNDLSTLPGVGSIHEGDWEYLSIFVIEDETGWRPEAINLSQHAGGEVLSPENVWWSSTNDPDYFGLEPGYSKERTHPHIWVAANSHALYSRFSPTYEVRVDLDPLCVIEYSDRADYNRSDHPHGTHRFFEYDRIVDLGEYEFRDESHDEHYLSHVEGPKDPLRFVGRLGDSFCIPLEGCGIGCDLPFYDQMSWAPRSPVQPDEPHRWRGFEPGPGRWGNDFPDPAVVSWREAIPFGDYLGEFSLCLDGTGDRIETTVGNAPPGVPGVAEIRVVSGNVFFEETDESGRIDLGLPANGRYSLAIAHASGAGDVAINVFASGESETPLAIDLIAEIRECGVSNVVNDSSERSSIDGIANRIRIGPNPSSGPVIVQAAAGHQLDAGTLRVSDCNGRTVANIDVPHGSSSLRWEGSDESGRAIPSGVYYLQLLRKSERVSLGSVTIVR